MNDYKLRIITNKTSACNVICYLSNGGAVVCNTFKSMKLEIVK